MNFFFGNRALDPNLLVPAIAFLDGAIVTQRAPNTFSCIVDRGGAVKLSFFGVPNLPRLLPPLIAEDTGLQVAHLLDLAGTKASVVQLRAEAKDYLDIDAILMDGRIDLPMAIAAAAALYGDRFNAQNTLKALCFFDDGDLGTLPERVCDRLLLAARDVDLDHFSVILFIIKSDGK